ncbi:MAG: hypothetical protein GX434_14555 [Peptococcaceae bacterium]|nr:hypothetical protein [Peptococcaceae bacterium]
MLIDKYMSDYQFSEKHEIVINASAEKIYSAILSTDFMKSFIIHMLFKIRGIPKFTIVDLTKVGFEILEEMYPKEIVIGLEGRFWTRFGSENALNKISRENFLTPQSMDVARVAWNFYIEEKTTDQYILTTETRISCTSKNTLRKFKIYWFIIKPGSGLVRKYMLREIRKQAEQPGMN